MNIDNLKEGQKIKNYKELCLLINDKTKGGNAKKAQLTELQRYIKYHREGYKFIIDKIYSEPLPKIDDVSLHNSKYIKEIECILVDYLYHHVEKGKSIQLSVSALIQILAMANNTYAKCNYKRYELAQILNMEISAILLFYNTSRSEFSRIIDRALKNLQNRAVLNVNTCYMIVYGDKKNSKQRVADTEEAQLIIDNQKMVLQYMNLNSFKDLFLAGGRKYKEYVQLYKKELPEGWLYTYKAYDLTVGTKAIAIERENLLKQKEILNNKIIEKLHRCLKVQDTISNENILIERLIDLKGYDEKLDLAIDELYKKNKIDYYNKLKDKDKEIINKETEKVNLKESYHNRDCADISEYFNYTNKILHKNKETHNDEYWNSLFDVIDNINK